MSRFLNDAMLPSIAWFGQPEKVVQAHMFIRNNQAMSKLDFKETFERIRDFLDDKGVQYGILLTAEGTYVFTSKKIKFDALMVKLGAGVNYHGTVKRAGQDINSINNFLEQKK